MDTPMSLVDVLKRKLTGQAAAPVRSAAAAPVEPAIVPSAAPVTVAASVPAPQPPRAGAAPPLPQLDPRGAPPAAIEPGSPAPAPALRPAAGQGAFVVQAAAFSTADRADRAARVLDGEVTRAGQYYRVRTGPFATRGEAEASLAKVRAAGYSDARILTNG
jgi:rare lipoprotein A